jgi:hypothetical protein
MLSIGDMADKLIIEDIKIFSIREKLHGGGLSDEEYARLNENMIILNENRSIIANALDEKINNVLAGKEKNVILKRIKTYALR